MEKSQDFSDQDQIWMKRALELARLAEAENEVPVGAIVVQAGQEVGSGWNKRENNKDPLAHAEILAIAEASKGLAKWRLNDCSLYVTLEPCIMCAGAIINARIGRVVYGASDPKAGAVESLYQILDDQRLNHRPTLASGLLADECSRLLKDFFQKLRN